MDERERLDKLNQEYQSLLAVYKEEIESNSDHQTTKGLAIHKELMRKHETITKLLPSMSNE